jgi:hypothetical protein
LIVIRRESAESRVKAAPVVECLDYIPGQGAAGVETQRRGGAEAQLVLGAGADLILGHQARALPPPR